MDLLTTLGPLLLGLLAWGLGLGGGGDRVGCRALLLTAGLGRVVGGDL